LSINPGLFLSTWVEEYITSNCGFSFTPRKLGKDGVSFNSELLYKKAQMPDPKTYKQHFENKHSKMPMPEELKDIQI